MTRSQLPDIPDTLKYRTLYILLQISQFQYSRSLCISSTLKIRNTIFKKTLRVWERMVDNLPETTQEEAPNIPRNIQRDAFQDKRALVEKFLNSM